MAAAVPTSSALCAVGLFLALAGGVDAAPRDQGTDAAREFHQLHGEVAAAQRAQDNARLSTAYAELAALQPSNPEYHRGHGLAAFLGGQYQQAISALERAVGLQPDLPGARLYLGMSLYRRNRFREALRALERAPEVAAGQPVALYWKGACHRALGQLEPAIASLETARRRAGTDANVLQLLTRSYSERSTELLRQLLASAPRSAAARLLKAEELAMDGVEQAAMRELDETLASSPEFIGLHLAKGEILWGQGNDEAGAAEFRMELANNPLSLEAGLRLAAYLLDQGEAADALPFLRRLARANPADARIAELVAGAQGMLGEVGPQSPDAARPPPSEPSLTGAEYAYREGRLELAKSAVKSLVAERPDWVEAHRLLARCSLAEGDDRQAAADLAAVLALQPKDPQALYLAGKAYERLASQTAGDLFALNPDSASVRLLRGEAFERGPNYEFEKALAEFRKAAELEPKNPGAHHAIGRVLFKMNRFDEALPHLRRVLAGNPRHGMANYLAGRIYLTGREWPAAIKHLEAAVEARPGLSDSQRDLARALVRAGRYDDGIGLYRKLVEADSSDSSLHALIAQAYRTAGQMDQARRHAALARSLAAAKHRAVQQ